MKRLKRTPEEKRILLDARKKSRRAAKLAKLNRSLRRMLGAENPAVKALEQEIQHLVLDALLQAHGSLPPIPNLYDFMSKLPAPKKTDEKSCERNLIFKRARPNLDTIIRDCGNIRNCRTVKPTSAKEIGEIFST